jgi:hypothetical protein
MAATNYTPISLYYSTTASASPLAGNLTNGELAINITDGKLFYKDNNGVVQTIAYKNTPISTLSGFGTGVATALGVNTGSSGAFVVNGGALGTPSSGTLTNATGLPVSTGVSGFGTGVAAALAVNTGSAGAFVVNGGALGTPSSGTVTNLTGTASIDINGTVGATTPAAGSFTNLSYTGTLTGGTGVINIGSGQVYKDASGNVGIGVTSTSGYKVAIGGSGLKTQFITTDANSAYLYTDGNAYIGSSGAFNDVFITNNTERMRIDSSGNVGIGTSSPGAAKLNVTSNVAAQSTVANFGQSFTALATDVQWTNANNLTSTTLISKRTDGGLWLYQSGADYIATYTNGTERMRIDSSGNVGIGTSSPNGKLSVIGASSATLGSLAQFTISGGQGFFFNSNSTGTLNTLAVGTGENLAFNTGASERMRIDSSGNLLVGKTSPTYTTTGVSIGPQTSQFAWSTNSGSVVASFATPVSQTLIGFYRTDTGAAMGTISNGASNTVAYNTSSDYRLKENIQPMVGALQKVARLKPVTYTWKSDGVLGEGFIAHELQAVVPDAVTGEKDAVNKDGSIKPQGIDTSFLVATLTAAIQEQQAIIEQLKADVAALKGRV